MRKLLILLICFLIPSGLSADFRNNIRDGAGRRISIKNDALDAQAGATVSTSNSTPSKIGHITVKLTTAQTPTVIITVNSVAGVAFDTQFVNEVFPVGEQNFAFVPDEEILLLRGDEVSVNVSGAGGACTANVIIVTKQLI